MKENNFTEGPILKQLLKFMLPILGAIFVQALYGAVDLLIVGRFAETASVSGVSVGSQLIHFPTALIIGLSVGTTVMLGQAIGAGEKKKGGDIIGSSICLFAGITLFFTALMVIFSRELLTLLHLPEEAMAEGMSYTVICSVGYIFISAYNVLGSVFRGIGDSRTPLIAVIISCIVNIGGDLLLCGVFKMAAAGAAIATVFAQAVSVFLSLIIASKKGLPFSFGKSNIRPHFAIMKRIVKLGMPVAIQSLVVAFSFLIMGAVVNDLGVNASAGYGIGGKLITFILLFPDACSQALSSYAAQNVGAGKYDRAQRALFHCIWMSLTFSVFSFCFAFFKGDILVQIFTSDPLVIPEGAANLKAYAFDTFLTSVMFCLIGYFNAFGKTFITLIQGVLGVCLRIAAALIFKAVLFNVFTVSLSTPIASFGQLILLGCYFLYFRNKLKKQQIQTGVTV